MVVPLGGDSPDAGHDGGFSCTYDIDCAPWHGLCADGGACQELPPDGGYDSAGVSNTCAPDGGTQPCAQFAIGSATHCTDAVLGNLCYCHADSYFDQGGVCYRAIPECGACTDSIDCGGMQTDLNGGNGSSCLPVVDAGDYCLYTYFGGCDKAYAQAQIDGGGAVCFPLCNTCPCIPCSSYDDCPGYALGVCQPMTGVCVAPCYTKQDCPPNDVCNVVDKYLDPQDAGLFYGYGECGPSCSNHSSCFPYEINTPSNPLVCIGDRQYPDGGFAVDDAGQPLPQRCRIDGCLNTDECIAADTDAGGTTWCDRWGGNVCVSAYCQLGTTASERAECQLGYCCIGGAGSAPQDDGGPSHGVCTFTPGCQGDASSGSCCDSSMGGS
jgi:hypothetical protein